ncbi:MAG TPA: hypothetical protein VFA04_23945 [Bryobacteraceae bacterium]|nr:hypothetical protein [Bryobacteraceae bacterium]
MPSSFASGLSCQRRVVLLAPSLSVVPHGFADALVSPADHENLLAQMQRLRGQIYLDDGAIGEHQLTADGRHQQAADNESWHLLAVGPDGVVQGCARYRTLREPVSFASLGVSHSAMAIDDRWGVRLREAIETDIAEAQARGLSYVEVGGWALTPELRCSTEALRIALATWALARVMGGCIGVTTATRRHCSASILRKIGGRSLVVDGQELPHYFDPSYECDMEILRFDSDRPNQRFEGWVEQWVRHLLSAPVLCRSARPSTANRLTMSTSVALQPTA